MKISNLDKFDSIRSPTFRARISSKSLTGLPQGAPWMHGINASAECAALVLSLRHSAI